MCEFTSFRNKLLPVKEACPVIRVPGEIPLGIYGTAGCGHPFSHSEEKTSVQFRPVPTIFKSEDLLKVNMGCACGLYFFSFSPFRTNVQVGADRVGGEADS